MQTTIFFCFFPRGGGGGGGKIEAIWVPSRSPKPYIKLHVRYRYWGLWLCDCLGRSAFLKEPRVEGLELRLRVGVWGFRYQGLGLGVSRFQAGFRIRARNAKQTGPPTILFPREKVDNKPEDSICWLTKLCPPMPKPSKRTPPHPPPPPQKTRKQKQLNMHACIPNTHQPRAHVHNTHSVHSLCVDICILCIEWIYTCAHMYAHDICMHVHVHPPCQAPTPALAGARSRLNCEPK